MRNFFSVTDTALFAMIDDLVKSGQNNFVEQCEALYELYKRGIKHPLHKPKGKHAKIYAHFENVALGRLHPSLVAYFVGHAGKLAKFATYGIETQKIIAGDRPFKIAMIDENGAIVQGEKIVRKMTPLELDFAFPGNGYLATFSDQSEKLSAIRAASPEVVNRSASIVQPHSAKSIKVRSNVVTLDELRETLASMGYEIVAKV